MRGIVLDGFGGIEVIQVGEVAKPVPAPGELLVQVAAAGVNRADLLQRKGFYPPPKGCSDILGLEVSGQVAQVGAGVDKWQVGDAVVALLAGGGYAEYVAVPQEQCAPPPGGINLIDAAGLIEVAATVVSNFNHVGLRTGEWVLVHGGAGGIGSCAIPYAKAIGAKVMTTVGSAEKATYAKSIGADAAFDYHDDWPAEVEATTGGKGAGVILDIIGAKYLEANVKALARGGRLVVIGLQGGVKGTLDLNRLLSKGATVTATSLRFRPKENKGEIVAEVANRLWPMFEDGTVPLPPIRRFTLDQAAGAHEHLESGSNIGKIVLTL
ncbi:MAG: NAD(P)H-quinone oxidoreductase [Micrococcales bacterium]|nr:NAD(P)H-quinone oxidoreductase [Micrococcales bacterium]